MILVGLALPLFCLAGAAGLLFLVPALPIPALQAWLNQPAREHPGLFIPFTIGFLMACFVGGYAGYRAWRLLALHLLGVTLVDAITQQDQVNLALKRATIARDEAHNTSTRAGNG
jgi:hypothetical protein